VDVIDQNEARVRLVRLRDVTRQLNFRQDTWSFHTGILHKLRTPLSSMIMSMSLIHQQLADQSNSMLQEMAEIALRGCDRLNEQISEILRYIQLDQPNLIGGRCPVGALSMLMAELGELLDIQQIEVTFAPAVCDTIVAVSRQNLELLFIELLSNAKKFHPHGRPSIEVYVDAANENVIIRVADDGVHLSPEQLIHVWQPYYQAEKYFTGEVRGMGLGLTMVAMRMWSVGGSCRIANREHGPGVMVTLQVPSTTV
jgi:signal transduction histidine kinase